MLFIIVDETLDADVSSDSYGVPLDNSNSAENYFEGDTSGCGAFDESVDYQCFG